MSEPQITFTPVLPAHHDRYRQPSTRHMLEADSLRSNYFLPASLVHRWEDDQYSCHPSSTFRLQPALPDSRSVQSDDRGVPNSNAAVIGSKNSSMDALVWEQLEHPKGGVFFKQTAPLNNLSRVEVVTVINPHEHPEVTHAFAHLRRAIKHGLSLRLEQRTTIHAAIDWIDDHGTIGYHLIDYQEERPYWIEESFDTDRLRLCGRGQEQHLELMFWQHVLRYPHAPRLTADIIQDTGSRLSVLCMEADSDRRKVLSVMRESLRCVWPPSGSSGEIRAAFINASIKHWMCQARLCSTRRAIRESGNFNESWMMWLVFMTCWVLLIAEPVQGILDDLYNSYCVETGKFLQVDPWSKTVSYFEAQWEQYLPWTGVVVAAAGAFSAATVNDPSQPAISRVCVASATIFAFTAGIFSLVLRYHFAAPGKCDVKVGERLIQEFGNCDLCILLLVTTFSIPSICMKVAGMLLLPVFSTGSLMGMPWGISVLVMIVALVGGGATFLPAVFRRFLSQRRRHQPQERATLGYGITA